MKVHIAVFAKWALLFFRIKPHATLHGLVSALRIVYTRLFSVQRLVELRLESLACTSMFNN